MPKEKETVHVSPNNPCPFLRALVQQDMLNNEVAKISDVVTTIQEVAKTSGTSTNLPAIAIRAIALIANGLGPVSVVRNGLHGLRLDELRGGPLDKKGVGSAILDTHGLVNEAELDRLGEFASDKKSPDGETEPGLDINEITKMMDDNFARAKGHRRRIDRKLMNGEWPALLKIMGKDGENGRYLSIQEIRTLFVDRLFPQRMMEQLTKA
ncbi:MAG: hypothetical protein AB8G18_13940 [Gammaproteobacteria bacterium]